VKHIQNPLTFALTSQCPSKTEEKLKHQGEAKRSKLKEITYCTTQQKRQWEEKKGEEKEEKKNIIQYFKVLSLKKQFRKKPNLFLKKNKTELTIS